jgi:undecaprenyl-diphosphatase
MLFDVVKAAILGVVEGLTEYIPVSSTGHMLLVEHFFNDPQRKAFWDSFTVLIQLGAILALLAIYFTRLTRLAVGFFTNKRDFRFVLGLLIAFVPAAAIGAVSGSYIKFYLFNPWVVSISLILGGFVLLWVESLDLDERYKNVEDIPLLKYLAIGICQCAAMIPGVSRSGASIVSAMLLGADRRTAAEFSFWLAMPTMVGAFAYDLYKNGAHMSSNDAIIIAVGFITSFIFGWIVVKTFLGYVSRHGFGLFAYWRILVGGAALVALMMGK